MGFGALDANLSPAWSRTAVGEFSRNDEFVKMEALDKGRLVGGRCLLFAVDQPLKLTAADGAVPGMEHPLVVTMKGDNLQHFVSDWDTCITGMTKNPEDQVLEAIFMGQLPLCFEMQDDIHDKERLPGDDPSKSYLVLYRTAKRHIERRRLQVHRGGMTKSIAGGSATAVAPKGAGKREHAVTRTRRVRPARGIRSATISSSLDAQAHST